MFWKIIARGQKPCAWMAVPALMLLCSWAGASGTAASSATVSDAFDRPALTVKRPAGSVLLGGATAGVRTVAVGERGLIMLSDDGGKQWRQVPVPTSVTLTAVRFTDERHGVAVGHAGTVLTTADAGETWVRKLDGRQLGAIAFKAASARGDTKGVQDAERLSAEGADKPFLDVVLWDARKFLAVGAYGMAFATEDGGQSWTTWMDRLPNPRGMHLYAARRAGEKLLLAGEQGLMLHSIDGGASFKSLTSPYPGSWFTAELGSGQQILLAGLRGNVWGSENDGGTWSQIPNPQPASVTTSLSTGGELLLGTQAGFVLKLKDGALVPVNRQAMPPLAGLVSAGDKLLGLGVAGVMPVNGGVQ